MAGTSNPFPGGGARGIVFAGGQWVAVGNDSGNTALVATSPDGNCWTVQTSPTGFTYGTVIDWSPSLGLFCMGGNGTSVIATSPDGVTWTTQTSPMDGNIVRGIIWASGLGLFIAAGQNTGATVTIMTSPDGAAWTAQTSPFDYAGNAGDTGTGVAWDNGGGVAVVVGGNIDTNVLVATSPDGATWTAQTTPLDANVPLPIQNAVSFSPDLGQFVTTGSFGSLMTSPDGVTWTVQTTPGGTAFYDVGQGVSWSHDLGLWVVATQNMGGLGKALITSPDGAAWTYAASGFDGLAGAAQPFWSGSLWIVAGGVGTLNFVLSTDGVTWSDAACAVLGSPVFNHRFRAGD